jgi:hypothetical protein
MVDKQNAHALFTVLPMGKAREERSAICAGGGGEQHQARVALCSLALGDMFDRAIYFGRGVQRLE